jgi:glycosyltransferase involved in cell wall biosynthesis
VRHTRFGKHGFVGRILNFLTFTAAAWGRCLWLPQRPDLVITETDPFFLPLVGRFLKWWTGCRFVAYLQDIYPDIAVAVGKVREGLITRCLRWLLVSAYRRADRVVVLSEDMRQKCLRNGVPAEHLAILPNWVDTTAIQPVTGENPFRTQQNCGDKFVVMYSGNMGVGHLLEPIIEAATLLRDQVEILFLLIGEGQQKVRLQQLVTDRGLTNVRFLPYQPRELLTYSLSAANVQLISMRPEVVECLMPSKLYGVLAAGVPSIVLAPLQCELSRVVVEQQAGLVCGTDAPEPLPPRLAAAISHMARDQDFCTNAGINARRLAVEEYDRRRVTGRFGELLRQVLDSPRR